MNTRRSVVSKFMAVAAIVLAGAIGGGPASAAAAPPVRMGRVQYLSIPGVAFFPTSASNYSNAGYITADPWAGWRWALSANPNLTAPVELPDGARIVSLTVNYRDTSDTGYTLAKLYEYATDHYGDGAPVPHLSGHSRRPTATAPSACVPAWPTRSDRPRCRRT